MTANASPTLLISSLKPALLEGMAQTVTVLVRVQAPSAPPAPPEDGTASAAPVHRRPKTQVALVLDRSGSMAGEPLREAVRCAKLMIDRLAPEDLASLVVFDHETKVLVPASPARQRDLFHHALDRIHAGGSTNLYGGWSAGLATLQPQAASDVLSRVLLLSDGNANVGEITDPAVIAAQAASAAGVGISTSTYGLGHRFNESLMVDMARLGGGNTYYGEMAADLFERFAEEFDLIDQLCARRVRVTIGAPEGVTVRVRNDQPAESRDGFLEVTLPDLAYGSEAWLLVDLEVSAAVASSGIATLLQVGATALTPAGVPLPICDSTFTLPTLGPAAFHVLLADPLVTSRKAELDAADLLKQARQAAGYGDWGLIDQLIGQARERFADQPWLSETLTHMAELARSRDQSRFSKEALYSTVKFSTRLADLNEATQDLLEEDEKSRFLRRRAAQGKTQIEPRSGSDRR